MRLEIETTGTLSFKKFYLRRIYRIFPPLYIMLCISLLLVYADVLHADPTLPAVTAQFLHFTNYYAIFIEGNNFLPGLSVLWSLAVEEHFYIIFPLIFLYLIKNFNYNQVALVLFLICLAVMLWRLHLVYNLNILAPYTYKATDARFDSIVFGCIMGVFSNPALDDKEYIKNELAMKAILAIAFLILLFCFLYRAPEFRQTIRYTLQGMALFPIFYLAISKSYWSLFCWLNWRPIKFIGIISYSFYLSHLIGLNFAARLADNNTILRLIIGFFLTTIFCTVMYVFVEKYFSQLRKKLHN